ncbi:MAG: DUF692 family protein, partial [Rickettsiales bacterium]|nr:DUF692 family protein [Rickettsiales bacterium]
MGLRPKHYPYIHTHTPPVDWFEIISENYMDTDGPPRRHLEKIRTHYPIVMHGVALSIGGPNALDRIYLQKLKTLADWLQPIFVSDHLCWTGNAHANTHDLLPMPYTEEALTHVVRRIQQVQEYLGQQLVLENPSTYLEFQTSSMPEWEFITRMAETTGCALLLDVNNVYVTCVNHRLDPKTYLDALPAERIAYVHIAGHETKPTHLLDTHEGPVIEPVWDLYRYLLSRTGPVATMIEWDTNIPDFPVVMAEVEKARTIAAEQRIPNRLEPQHAPHLIIPASGDLPTLQQTMHHAILPGQQPILPPDQWIRAKENFPATAQLAVYQEGYRFRLFDILYDDYPALRAYLGEETFSA